MSRKFHLTITAKIRNKNPCKNLIVNKTGLKLEIHEKNLFIKFEIIHPNRFKISISQIFPFLI